MFFADGKESIPAAAPPMNALMFVLLLFLTAPTFAVEPGSMTPAAIDTLLKDAQASQKEEGDKIDTISGHFLGTAYKANTLIGSARNPEKMVVRLDGVDCMTYVEYVEALRRSNAYDDFVNNLRRVRYKDGRIDFRNRNHFFLNWPINNAPFVVDVTRIVGDAASRRATKQLNSPRHKPLIPGIPIVEVSAYYIPGHRINDTVVGRLQSGDYVGLYTDRVGLDVTHVGIVIKKGAQTFFRHASNEHNIRKVVDAEFVSFFKRRRGFVVFRPVAQTQTPVEQGRTGADEALRMVR
jgi:hypothetical protein